MRRLRWLPELSMLPEHITRFDNVTGLYEISDGPQTKIRCVCLNCRESRIVSAMDGSLDSCHEGPSLSAEASAAGKSLGLSDQEKHDLIEYLKSL